MTRSESYEIRTEIFHTNYLRERDRRLAYAANYYRENREKIAEYNRMKRNGLLPEKIPEYIRPSTDAFEEELPLPLKMNKQRLRQQFLAIPIHERPVYDYFLRCKTIEYERERRKYNHPDIIAPRYFTGA